MTLTLKTAIQTLCMTLAPDDTPSYQVRLQKGFENIARTKSGDTVERLFIYLFIEGLSPRQLHRITSGLFTSSNRTQVIPLLIGASTLA